MEIIKTGSILDKLLKAGGIPVPRHGKKPSYPLVVVVGNPGAGKTILTLQILNNLAKQGYSFIYATSEQDDLSIIQQAQQMGFDDFLTALEEGRGIILTSISRKTEYGKYVYLSNYEKFKEAVKDFFENIDTDKRAVAVDSVSNLWASKPAVSRDIATKLKSMFSYNEILGIATSQVATMTGEAYGKGIEYIGDIIVKMKMFYDKQGGLTRIVLVEKARLTDHEKRWRKFKITESGIVLADRKESEKQKKQEKEDKEKNLQAEEEAPVF